MRYTIMRVGGRTAMPFTNKRKAVKYARRHKGASRTIRSYKGVYFVLGGK